MQLCIAYDCTRHFNTSRNSCQERQVRGLLSKQATIKIFSYSFAFATATGQFEKFLDTMTNGGHMMKYNFQASLLHEFYQAQQHK